MTDPVEITNPVPANTDGKPVDIEKKIVEADSETAALGFRRVKQRLLNPDMWEALPGFVGATFMLQKMPSNSGSSLEVNDYLKIDIPGPGPAAGDGFDWVQVENITENFDSAADESFACTLKAAPNPQHEKEEPAAHFFKDKATSTFVLKRKNKELILSYHGRNEIPNLKGLNLHDKIRNALVAFGALAGLSEMQWSVLLSALLSDEIKNKD